MENMTSKEFNVVSDMIQRHIYHEVTEEAKEKAQVELEKFRKKRSRAETEFRQEVWKIMKTLMPLTWKAIEPYMTHTGTPLNKERAALREALEEPIDWWYSEFEMALKDALYIPKDRQWEKNQLGKVIMVQ